MIIREAINRDVSAISRVHVDTWRTSYHEILPSEILANLSYEKRENAWHQILNHAPKDGNCTYVAEDRSGQIVGFANGGVERAGNPVYKGELNAIYILENHQRKGIGRKLVRVVAERLYRIKIHSMLVWVLKDNSACRFYEMLGGEKVDKKEIKRGGTKLIEIAYGWSDTSKLRSLDANFVS